MSIVGDEDGIASVSQGGKLAVIRVLNMPKSLLMRPDNALVGFAKEGCNVLPRYWRYLADDFLGLTQSRVVPDEGNRAVFNQLDNPRRTAPRIERGTNENICIDHYGIDQSIPSIELLSPVPR